MPERIVLVRLKAAIDDYTSKMAQAARATVSVSDAGKKVESSLTTAGKSARDVGAGLTKYVSLPMAAAGVAAVKLSVDFEDSFAKMQGLAGVSADEVEGLKQQVLDLSRATAVGPQELAEGLYFVRSAGLAGQTALDAITVSARGAAAGLGSTASIADALTSAINAYGSANLSAAQAGDVLVATAREGKAEASQLAPQFGRILPIAAELGVRFDEVGAGLAFLSRNSGDAALSATQLTSLLQKLLKPSQTAEQALSGVGISVDDIRKSISEKGLLATLQDLRARLGDSGFKVMFDDIQGLEGALALTGNQAGQAQQVFDDLAHSAGSLDSAFDAASKTTGFKMRQAWADLQAAAIQAGDAILPIVAGLADGLASLVGWFARLPKPAQDALLIFAGYAAVIGPIINLVGRMVEGLGKLQVKLVENAQSGAQSFGQVLGRGGLAYNIGVATAAITTMVVALDQWNQMISTSKRQGQSWADTFNKGFDVNTANIDQITSRISEIDRVIGNIRKERSPGWQIWDADANAQFDAATDALGKQHDQLVDVRNKAFDVAVAMGIDLDSALKLVTNHSGDLKITTDQGKTSFDQEAAAVALVTDKLKEQSDALKAQFDPLFAVLDASNQLRDVQQRVADDNRNVTDAEAKLRWERAAHGAASREAADAERELEQAQRDLGDTSLEAAQAAEGVQSALFNLAQGVATGTVNIDAARMMLQSWVDQGLITQQQADDTSNKFVFIGGAATNLANTVNGLNQTGGVNLPVTAPGLDQVNNSLAQAQAAVDAFWKAWNDHAPGGPMAPAPPINPDDQNVLNQIFGHHAYGGKLGPGWNVVGEGGLPELIYGRTGEVYPLTPSRARGFPTGAMSPHSALVPSSVNSGRQGGTDWNVQLQVFGNEPRRTAREAVNELRAYALVKGKG